MINDPQNNCGSPYEIRLKDHLESHWAAFFDGWSITNLENGEVLLKNLNIDQAGLHGVLNKIRDLNLTLLSVNKTTVEGKAAGPERMEPNPPLV